MGTQYGSRHLSGYNTHYPHRNMHAHHCHLGNNIPHHMSKAQPNNPLHTDRHLYNSNHLTQYLFQTQNLRLTYGNFQWCYLVYCLDMCTHHLQNHPTNRLPDMLIYILFDQPSQPPYHHSKMVHSMAFLYYLNHLHLRHSNIRPRNHMSNRSNVHTTLYPMVH